MKLAVFNKDIPDSDWYTPQLTSLFPGIGICSLNPVIHTFREMIRPMAFIGWHTESYIGSFFWEKK